MAEDEDVGGSFEGKRSLRVFFYEQLDRARHDDNGRTPHSTGMQGFPIVQVRILQKEACGSGVLSSSEMRW